MLKWRVENKKNIYNTLVQWWNDWGFPVIPFPALPERIFVTYIEDGDNFTDIYAVPVFITDANIAWIGFPTSNKNSDSSYRKDAFKYLLGVIEVAMKYQGYSTLLTTSMHPKLMNDYEASGFIKSDENTNFYTKEL